MAHGDSGWDGLDIVTLHLLHREPQGLQIHIGEFGGIDVDLELVADESLIAVVVGPELEVKHLPHLFNAEDDWQLQPCSFVVESPLHFVLGGEVGLHLNIDGGV